MFIDLEKYRFTFGKYKGRLIKDILEEDASYILWAHDEVKWFLLSPDDEDKVHRISIQQRGNMPELDEYIPHMYEHGNQIW